MNSQNERQEDIGNSKQNSDSLEKVDNAITLESLGSFATLSFKFAATYGFLILFIDIYKINWFPIGISLSEAGAFLILGLGCSILILIFYVMPVLLINLNIAQYKTITKCTCKKLLEPILVSIFLIMVILLLIFLFRDYGETKRFELLLLYFILIIASSSLLYFSINKSTPRDIKIMSYYILFSFLSLESVIIMVNFHQRIPILLGFSKSEIAIQLSESDFKLVQAQVRQREITDIKCDEENRIVWPVRVHLRGIGTHSLISFYHPKKELKKKGNNEGVEFLRMEVKTDESKLIGIPHNEGENCYNPSASAPAAASAATSLEAITASTEAIYDDDKMSPNL